MTQHFLLSLEVLLSKLHGVRFDRHSRFLDFRPHCNLKNRMVIEAGKFEVAKAIASNLAMIKARPSINWFFCQYLRKFTVVNVGGNLVVHSHLPPLNSLAYKRFVGEHLLSKAVKPSHAQIGITNICPQHCEYCYNKGRTGDPMDTETILGVIRDLKSVGVFWIGITGGEPLLNKDLPGIVEAIGDNCASKLFTTGCGLTKELAKDLKQAGLIYATISLDHWSEERHDNIRKYKGAFKAALRAIETFLGIGGIHVSVSAVLSKAMLKEESVEELLDFLKRLEIHEAWLSEAKPSVQSYWDRELVITDQERLGLMALQDRYNKQGGMTVNYLSHFEDVRHFGCTAGHKMVYVDTFGEVSPCVFIPMTFGNVQNRRLTDIVSDMQKHFPSEGTCFINKNYETIQRHFKGTSPIDSEESLNIMKEIEFGPLSRFFSLQYKS
jgi:MoaA/NifB/PqqE/SkfB family radical SAM enzyme